MCLDRWNINSCALITERAVYSCDLHKNTFLVGCQIESQLVQKENATRVSEQITYLHTGLKTFLISSSTVRRGMLSDFISGQ